MGFHEKVVALLMQCVNIVSYAIIVNGSPIAFFKPTRVLRQGDLLSPYLFLFVSNVLSFAFQHALNFYMISGFRINRRCPFLTHLLFVEDTLLLGRATNEEASVIKSLIDTYFVASGQRINYAKSSIVFSHNVARSIRDSIRITLGMSNMAL